MYIPNDVLLIDANEQNRYLYMSKILKYLELANLQHYYLFFGYEEGNVDIDQYRKEYPNLNDNHGFIKLNKEDKTNYKLITDLLFDYQTAGLYINNYPDLDKKYNFASIRDDHQRSLFDGYALFVQEGEGPLLKKQFETPNWNTDLIAIPLTDIWVKQTDQTWTDVQFILNSKEEARKVLKIIDSVFAENKIVSITQNSKFEISDVEYLSKITITTNQETGIKPKIVIEGRDVTFYIFSVVHIITIKDALENSERLKEWIEHLFFSKIVLIRKDTKYLSITFIKQDELLETKIQLTANPLAKLTSYFGKKEVFIYEPIYKLK